MLEKVIKFGDSGVALGDFPSPNKPQQIHLGTHEVYA